MGEKPRVFFLPWEARGRLPELLDRSGAADPFRQGDLTAVKIHFGEKGNDGYVRPDLVRPVLQLLRRLKTRPFLTDTGTIYHGLRNNAVSHMILAADHGFTQTRLQVPVIIADGLRGDDYEEVAVGGRHFARVKIASGIRHADSLMVLSHFKGHLLSGFGGAIKNLGMGCGARIGKFEMHSGVAPTLDADACEGCGACVVRCAQEALSLCDGKVRLDADRCAGCGECVVVCDSDALSITWSQGASSVQERFAEYAAGAVKGRRAFYLNFVNHVTPNCDCLSAGETPLLPDVGIIASADPVAIDQASLDLIAERAGDVFRTAHPKIDGTVQLVRAEEMGLGKRAYELVAL